MVVNLMESIVTTIFQFSGLEPAATSKTFGLSNPTIGVYALIFVNEIRLDLSSQTIVADACVIPLTAQNHLKVNRTMTSSSEQRYNTIATLDDHDETRAWKALLPALAERCREWKHRDSCKYGKRSIPACEEGIWDRDASTLCRCGLGKNRGAFAKVASWKSIQSEASRIAIGPLFPFSFLQRWIKDMIGSEVSKVESCGYCNGPGLPNVVGVKR